MMHLGSGPSLIRPDLMTSTPCYSDMMSVRRKRRSTRSTPNAHGFRLGSGAARSSTASRMPMLWLLASANMFFAGIPQVAANNLYPEQTTYAQQVQYMPMVQTLTRSPSIMPKMLRGYKYAPVEIYNRIAVFINLLWSVGIFGVAILMFQGPNIGGTTVHGPAWDPAGNVPFRDWLLEV